MAVALHTGNITTEIGTADFVHAFFSTISSNLEPDGWGTRFPELMNNLYQGSIDAKKSVKAASDLITIREELQKLSPDKVVWDSSNPSLQPPWGKKISPSITDLSNYFVTNNGLDALDMFIEHLQYGAENTYETTIGDTFMNVK